MDKVDKTLGVALGSGVTTNPMQMAQAYSVFANGGVMNDAHLITKIENASGQVVKTHRQTSTRVLNGSTTDKMNSMMLGTFSNGTGIYAAPYGYTMLVRPVRLKRTLTQIYLVTNGLLVIRRMWLSASG